MEQIEERVFHIVNNVRTLTHDNKIGALQFDKGGEFWAARMSHVIEEMRRRGGGLPPISNYADELKGVTAPIPEVESRIEGLGLSPDRCFVKFSRREYNEEAFRTGHIRIGAASSYDSDALARAVRDRELERVTYPSDDPFTISPHSSEAPRRLVESKRRSTTDYFLYSLAQSYERRLFHDFRADSCLLIRDINAFVERVIHAVVKRFPSFIYAARTVSYYDPFDAAVERLDIQFSKPFGYAYQKEFRIAWLPRERQQRLVPFFVDIGSLEDIAELVV